MIKNGHMIVDIQVAYKKSFWGTANKRVYCFVVGELLLLIDSFTYVCMDQYISQQ